jgi:group I intron endonuclease
MEKTVKIYFIFNKINNKFYIGVTNNIKRRWSDHKRIAKGGKDKHKEFYAIHQAISNYGLENFIFKEFCECSNYSEAFSYEKELINFFLSNKFKLYNETGGGEGWTNLTKEQCEKRR